MARIDAVSEAPLAPYPQVDGTLPVTKGDVTPLPGIETARSAPSPIRQTDENLNQTPALGPVTDVETSAIDHLFEHKNEGEIAISVAVLVVKLEELSLANAPENVRRGHAALAEMARMFEHLNLMRSAPNPEAPQ